MRSYWVIDSPGPGGACLSIAPTCLCHVSKCPSERVMAVTQTLSWPESTLCCKESSIQGLAKGSTSSVDGKLVSPEKGALFGRPSDAIDGNEEDSSNAKTTSTSLRRTSRWRGDWCLILTAWRPVKYKSRDTKGGSESRSVVVHHLGFWSRGPWFESGRDYQIRQLTVEQKTIQSGN